GGGNCVTGARLACSVSAFACTRLGWLVFDLACDIARGSFACGGDCVTGARFGCGVFDDYARNYLAGEVSDLRRGSCDFVPINSGQWSRTGGLVFPAQALVSRFLVLKLLRLLLAVASGLGYAAIAPRFGRDITYL